MAAKPTRRSEKEQRDKEHTLLYAAVAAIVIVLVWGFATNWWSSSNSTNDELTDAHALTFCENLADENAEYGFEKSLSDTSFEHDDGNVVVVFRNAKLGNQNGAQQQVNIKCTVSGTDAKPHLESFDSF